MTTRPGRSERPLARLLAGAAVLMLGTLAAARLPIGYLPSTSFPEIEVTAREPRVTDIRELTRRLVLPVESAIRSLGDVRGALGEVDQQGATLRVLLTAGSDPEAKAARLDAELATLRRQAPPESILTVRPVTQGTGAWSAVVWLGSSPAAAGQFDDSLANTLVAAVADLDEVREAFVTGVAPREIRLEPRQAAIAGDIERALTRGLAFARLGDWPVTGQRRPVVVSPLTRLEDLRLPLAATAWPVTELAEVTLESGEPALWAHFEGRRGRFLLLRREVEASPLALRAVLITTLRDFGLADEARFLIDEGEPLRLMLKRLGFGLVVTMTLLAALAWKLGGWRAAWMSAASPLLTAAAAAQAFLFADLPIDVTTLPALVIAVASGLLFVALRRRRHTWSSALTWLVAAVLLPVAVGLVGGRLGPLLAIPARAYAVALAAALPALLILPPGSPAAPRPWFGKLLRASQRQTATVLLAASTATCFLFIFFGQALAPHAGRVSPLYADLVISLAFAPGTSAAQAEAQVTTIEKHLEGLEEVDGHWSVFDRQAGSVAVRLRPQHQPWLELRGFISRLRSQLVVVGGAVRVDALADGGRQRGQVALSERLEERAEYDKDTWTYRLILRATDLAPLEAAHRRLVDLLDRQGYRRRRVYSDWGEWVTRVEISPKPAASAEEVAAVEDLLLRRARQPRLRPLDSDGRVGIRVMDEEAPRRADQVPQLESLLAPARVGATQIVPRALLEVREVASVASIKRQNGRFVLPVSVKIRGSTPATRDDFRSVLAGQLVRMPLPPGIDLELPEVNPYRWRPESLRLAAIAALLPPLLLALAICRTSSFIAGGTAVAPLVIAVAVVTPWVAWRLGHLDEMTLLALAAALAGTLPASLEITASTMRSLASPLGRGAAYRSLARRSPALLAAGGAAAMLAILPTFGLDAERFPWVLPLSSAGWVIAVVSLTSCLVLPQMLAVADRLAKHDREAEKRALLPPRWQQPGSPEIVARHLNKIYGNGFHALKSVDFRLEPGIVGLLGPNGAGKTTLLRLLCGLLEPSRGQVLFRGVAIDPRNLASYRRQVGFLPQDFNAYEGFTAARFLDYWAACRGLTDGAKRRREIDMALTQVGLEAAAGRKVRDLSGGMRRRLGIARALLAAPPILIVDEPTTGLDIESRDRLRQSLLAVAADRIVLFSTHIASDVAAAAARILVLHQGRLIFDGASRDLCRKARGRVFETLISDGELSDFSRRYGVTARVRTPLGIRVRAVGAAGEVITGDEVEPNLEEAYLTLIRDREERRDRSRARRRSLLDLSPG